MDHFMNKFASDSAHQLTDITDTDLFLGVPRRPPPPEYDEDILKLLKVCLKQAGTPREWHSLYKYPIVNGVALPLSQPPPEESWIMPMGHYIQKFDGYILWVGLTVAMGNHAYNHAVRLYPDGKIVGTFNGFGFGVAPLVEASGYLSPHLDEWLREIKRTEGPYWDEIDHKPL
jgi:hypothetical protein